MGWSEGSRFVEVRGRRTHCVDVGEGPVVVALHGFLHASTTWRDHLTGWARGWRVIAPDLLGSGWTQRGPGDHSIHGLADHVRAVLDALRVEDVHLVVGHSLGGGVALRWALAEPERVRRLLLVSSVGGVRLPIPQALGVLGHPAWAPVFRATAGNAWFVRPALRLMAYKRRVVDASVLEGFRPLRRRGSLTTAVEMAQALGPGTAWLAARLGEVRAETFVVWGGRDRVLPVRHGRALAAGIPGARFEVFDDCGHCPHEGDPARFAALTRAFAASG